MGVTHVFYVGELYTLTVSYTYVGTSAMKHKYQRSGWVEIDISLFTALFFYLPLCIPETSALPYSVVPLPTCDVLIRAACRNTYSCPFKSKYRLATPGADAPCEQTTGGQWQSHSLSCIRVEYLLLYGDEERLESRDRQTILLYSRRHFVREAGSGKSRQTVVLIST